MKVIVQKLRYRWRRRNQPSSVGRRRGIRGILAGVLIMGMLGYGTYHAEKRIGPMAQEVALSTLNNHLIREINLAAARALEKENIRAGSILQEEKNQDGIMENIVTDYTAANRVKTAIAVAVAEILEENRRVVAEIPVGAFFSPTLMTGWGVPVSFRVLATHGAEISFLDTFDAAGINQTRQQLSLSVRIPVRIMGVFSHRDGVVATEVPLAESVLIGTVPHTYVSTGD